MATIIEQRRYGAVKVCLGKIKKKQTNSELHNQPIQYNKSENRHRCVEKGVQ